MSERSDLYQKAYNVWSEVRQCIELGQKVQESFQEWLKVKPEWEKRIRSEISRFEAEMGVTAPEEEKEKLVSRLLTTLRGIEEEEREGRVVKEVKEFMEAVKERLPRRRSHPRRSPASRASSTGR